MARNHHWLVLAVVVSALALPGVQPVQGQQATYAPAAEYVLW